ncbi:MAG: peptidoglycan DD-metalloendopeptidase family protein [Firmicutes bacterium]|nr:peptidoglycan DD-metalloendopeptidase family protein [Bacillota bacterium]
MVTGNKNMEASYIRSEQRGAAAPDGKPAGHKRLRLRTLSTALVLGMLALVVIFGSSAASLSSSAYAVAVDGEQVAVLVSQQEADEAVELALTQEQQKWTDSEDFQLEYDNDLEIQTLKDAGGSGYSSVTEAAGLLAEELSFSAACVELYIEDQPVCYLASADDAIQAVNLVKGQYGSTDEDGVSAVYSEQQISFIETKAPLSDVLSAEDAADLLQGGEDGAPLMDVVVERTSKQVEVLPYSTIKEDDDTMARGDEKVVTAGVDGTQEVSYLQVERNGEVISQEAVGSEVLTPAVDEVIHVGTQLMYDGHLVGELQWPLLDHQGIVSSWFGWRDLGWHSGLDVANAIYTPIVAAEAGTVTFASMQGGYGNLIIIDHGDGLTTYYAHCDQFYVSVGDTVSRGQVIANIGMTGHTTGPHVHFEVRIDDNAVNPAPYIGAE